MTTTYIISEIDNQSYCKSNGQFTRHLRKNNLTYKDYHELYVTKITPLCYCLKPLTFYQKDESYANSCGDPVCVGKTISDVKQNWTQEQIEQDRRNKQLAAQKRTPEQIQEQKEKASRTSQERYGVKWVTQSKEYKDKSKQTKLERYGNEYYAGWEQSAAKNRNKTISEQNAINDMRRQTNLDRYGVEHCLNRNTLSKSAKSNSLGKEYVMPSGKKVGVRGYENLVLDRLLSNYEESELFIDDRIDKLNLIPVYTYVNVNQHNTKYYPDIYIPKENLIIEVKSEWWWNGKLDPRYHSRLINNLRKRQAVLDDGYRYQVWLFSNKYTYRILEDDTDF